MNPYLFCQTIAVSMSLLMTSSPMCHQKVRTFQLAAARINYYALQTHLLLLQMAFADVAAFAVMNNWRSY